MVELGKDFFVLIVNLRDSDQEGSLEASLVEKLTISSVPPT